MTGLDKLNEALKGDPLPKGTLRGSSGIPSFTGEQWSEMATKLMADFKKSHPFRYILLSIKVKIKRAIRKCYDRFRY